MFYTANPLYSSSLTLKKFADSPAGRVQSLPFCWSVTVHVHEGIHAERIAFTSIRQIKTDG
jgi:hypothetical protein